MKTLYTIFFAASLSLAGCNGKQENKTVTSSSVTAEVSDAALVRLDEADKVDGAADHVIGKCYVCGLGMNGSDEFVVKVKDYSAHLCSQACQHEFEKSADEIVLRTDIPNAEPVE